MKNNLVKLICLLVIILIHASCTDCNKCKKDCADCQVVVDTSDVDTSTILYTMDNQSIIDMLNALPDCAGISVVDIPVPDDSVFVLVPLDANMHPLQHGNWMKGSRRCPPACDVTVDRGPAGPPLLSSVSHDEKERFLALLENVPQNVANSVVIPRERLTSIPTHELVVVMVPDDRSISILAVTDIELNTGHEGRVHMPMHH